VPGHGADPDLLRRAVGGLADALRRLALGDDPRPVVPDRPSKSSSSENTYNEDLLDLDAIRAEIERMARQTAEWLARKGLLARTVTIKVRFANFATVTRSHTAAAPTRDPGEIAARALTLLERTDAGRRPIRLLGAGVHGLAGGDAAIGAPGILKFED